MDRRTFLKLLGASGVFAGPLGCGPQPRPITIPGNRSFEHPRSEAELVALVERARRTGTQLRVRGSLHSHSDAIFTDEGVQHINVQLDRYKRILHWDKDRQQVTVEAGINLGVDPRDCNSSPENSLVHQLQARGWALPDLGGIKHQTVGGFLSTGSMGGTVHYDVGEAVVAMRIVAGDGKVYELRPNPADPNDVANNYFYAAGVSMGLLGIISTVTFQCVDSYNIIGEQRTLRIADSPVDIYGDSQAPNGLRRFMEEQTYNRLLLWPQREVQKVQLWSARRATEADNATTHRDGAFVPNPLDLVPEFLGSKDLGETLVYQLYSAVDRKAPPYDKPTLAVLNAALKEFLPNERTPFWDHWYDGLTMDDEISDTFMPTEFTELFMDIEQTGPVMQRLRDHFAGDKGMDRTGPYAHEIYPARKSHFWLSPAFGRDSVRVDVFWFKTGRGHAQGFYTQFWELLKDFDLRFHWGKHLSPGDSPTGIAYRRASLPHWDRFLAARQRFDPDGIFLTRYWREQLGIG